MSRSCVWLMIGLITILATLVSGCEGIEIIPDQKSVQSSVEAEVVKAVALQTYEAVAKMTSAAMKDRTVTVTDTIQVTATTDDSMQTQAQEITQTPDLSVTPEFTASATIIAGPGDRAELISCSVPPGTIVNAGTSFKITWNIKNVGTNAWTPDYEVIFVSGEDLGAPLNIKLAEVSPGQILEISMNMTMPKSGSRYVGNWKLRNPGGEFLLIANTEANSLVVDVNQPVPTALPYISPTNTPLPTLTRSITPSPTHTFTASMTPTKTYTNTPNPTATPVKSYTPTLTRTSGSGSVPAPSLISPSGSITCTTSVRLSWSSVNPPNGLAYYMWYIQSSSGSDEGSTFNNFYDITGIVCGETYTWKVQAVDSFGNVSAYSSSFQFKPN